MEEWKEYSLGEIGKVITGKTPRTAITDNYGGEIPFLSPSDDMTSKFVLKTARYLTEKGLSEVKNCLIPEGAICVSCIGSDMGKSVITKRPTVTNQQINSIILNESFDSNFIYYVMQSKRKEIRFLGGNGTAVPILNKSAFSNLTIFAPERATQLRIASILSSLDDKIAVNKKICDNLEAQAQALFKHWFVDFAPFKDGRFVESELGLIPEGWRVGKLEEMASVVGSGGTPKSSVKEYYIGDILWYGTGEFNDSFIFDSEKHISQEAIDNSSAKIFPIHTVLIAMYGATVGKLAILSNEASFNQAALGIVAADSIGFPFIYLTLLACRKQLIRLACGAAQQNLNAGTIKSHLTIIPNDNIMMLFNDLILPIFEKVECLQKESSRLASLRDTLLPKLMSGQIKVDDLK